MTDYYDFSGGYPWETEDTDYSWWDEMGPYEQEALQSQIDPYFGMPNVNMSPGGYDFASIAGMGGYAPQIGMEDYSLLGYGGGLPPELNKYGELMPWGMDQEAQATTLQKNRNSLLVDRMMSTLAGPGAFSSTAFDPITVTPAMAGEAAIEQPGRRRATALLGGGGYETFIADAIFNRGLNPSEATAEMWELVSSPESEVPSEEQRQLRADLMETLPTATVDALTAQQPSYEALRKGIDLSTPEGRAMKWDVKGIDSFARDLFNEVAQDPEGVWTDPETGEVYSSGPKQVDSAMTKWYKDYGLPTPVESYMDESGLALLGMPQTTPEEDLQDFALQDEADLAYQDAIAAENRQKEIGRQVSGGLASGRKAYEEQMERPAYGFGGQTRRELLAEGARQQEVPRIRGQGRDIELAPDAKGNLLFNFSNFIDRAREEKKSPSRRATDKDMRRIQSNARGARNMVGYRGQQAANAIEKSSTSRSRDSMAAIGRAVAAQLQGRTPLRDALTQRMMGQRATGLYGGR